MLKRMSFHRVLFVLAPAVLIAVLSAARGIILAAPQNAQPQGLGSGVYTAAQAERGKEAYIASCQGCHIQDLTGGTGPALKGESFMSNWQGKSVSRLFAKIRDTMPPTFGFLDANTKLDIVAYLIRENGLPAGNSELVQDTELLDLITITKDGAPASVTDFSSVQTTGCLTAAPGNKWRLTRASEPVPARNKLSDSATLGEETFLLINAARFHLEKQASSKLLVRGLLYRSPGDNRINLSSVDTVSERCEP